MYVQVILLIISRHLFVVKHFIQNILTNKKISYYHKYLWWNPTIIFISSGCLFTSAGLFPGQVEEPSYSLNWTKRWTTLEMDQGITYRIFFWAGSSQGNVFFLKQEDSTDARRYSSKF